MEELNPTAEPFLLQEYPGFVPPLEMAAVNVMVCPVQMLSLATLEEMIADGRTALPT